MNNDHEILLAYLHDELGDAELAALEQRLCDNPQLADHLARLAFDEGNLAEWAKGQTDDDARPEPSRQPARSLRHVYVAVASVALLVAVAAFVWLREPAPVAVLTERASADFAEPADPIPVGGALESDRDYALRSGMVQVEFNSGVVVIVEGPAVFRIVGPMLMEADLGGYSVDVPQGAEGFRIHSPSAQVKDLGTRFSVHIAETGETEVQVVEGLTEVIRDGEVVSELTTGEAERIDTADEQVIQPIRFDPSRFRSQLPDRLLGYDATAGDGGVDELLGVRVQRGGKAMSYSAGELIAAKVIHFGAGGNVNVLSAPGRVHGKGSQVSAEFREKLLEDWRLHTGALNPGGSRTPLESDPNLTGSPESPLTPGLAVRFDQPVVNGPGPDVVFFELQMNVHPPQGDAFHVSPLAFEPGLQSHTVTRYDIDRRSDEAQRVALFHLHTISPPPTSLDALLNEATRVRNPSTADFKVMAVGIDLTSLGYSPGAKVEGIFIQDAADDENLVDPTLIAGLPAVD